MRKYIKKLFWAWDSEKEEKWLNEMSAKGLALVDYSFCRYAFEECEPGEYCYKIQLLEHRPSHPESEMYLRFMEETGAEQVASYMNWVYFRKKTAEGEFELFSDIESKMRHLILIKKLLLPIAILNLWIFLMNLVNFALNYPSGIWIPFINLACAVLVLFGVHAIQKKINVLKKEHAIRE